MADMIYTSFNYLGINSRLKNLIVTSFEPDDGETETNLQLEPIYTDSAMGMRRYDYGAKWNSVATFRITVIKPDGTDFSVAEVRGCLKWLTGTTVNTTLELIVGEQIRCTFNGRITNVWQQKQAARTIGLVLEFTSTSPFAYSPKQTITKTIHMSDRFQIECPSDDLFSSVYLKTTYNNITTQLLNITNETTGEQTSVSNLAQNETIVIDPPHSISSDNAAKTFGNSFNFVFPRLVPGLNEFVVSGYGELTFEFVYPIKIGTAVNVDELINTIDCNSNPGPGTVVVEHTAWENIWDKPYTIAGFGITDAYTKTEIDSKVKTINNTITKTKNELNTSIDNAKKEINSRIDSEVQQLNEEINDAIVGAEASLLSRIDSEVNELNRKITDQSYDFTLRIDNVNKTIDTKVAEINKSINNANNNIDKLAGSVYTKSEVDAIVASVYEYKGSVTNSSKLPKSGMSIGDVYNLEDTGMNVAWNGTGWDNLGSITDLTPYLTKDDASTVYATKTDVGNVYTKSELDSILENFAPKDVYTKEEIDDKFDNIDMSTIDTYTKKEIDEKIGNITSSGVDISEDELNKMLEEVLG